MNCDFQTNESGQLKKHISLKHEKQTSQGSVKCYNCEDTFSDFKNLMRHRKAAHPEIAKPCKYYNDGKCMFNAQTCWWTHETFTEQTTTDQIKCSICEKGFMQRKTLMSHKKQEHGEAVKPCEKFLYSECKFNDQCWFKHVSRNSAVKASAIAIADKSSSQDFCLDMNKKSLLYSDHLWGQ